MSTSSNLIWKFTDDDANFYFRWTVSISMQIPNVTSNETIVQPNDLENSLEIIPSVKCDRSFLLWGSRMYLMTSIGKKYKFFPGTFIRKGVLQDPRSRAEPPLIISCNYPSIWKGDNKYISVTLESWLCGLASQINVKGKWNIMHPKAKICNCPQSLGNAQKEG